MGYVKQKCSIAGKVSVKHFEEVREEFLADLKAEVLMHDIPIDLVFNWNRTGIKLVPTGEWTMHLAKEKSRAETKGEFTLRTFTLIGLPLCNYYYFHCFRCA